MSLFKGFDQDTILWFIILFLLLFWCGDCKGQEETQSPAGEVGGGGQAGGHEQIDEGDDPEAGLGQQHGLSGLLFELFAVDFHWHSDDCSVLYFYNTLSVSLR